AGAVYLNEHQEHEATLDFHRGTHDIVRAVGVGAETPQGLALEDKAEQTNDAAENHQERAARYTLAEGILATSLFLLGVAGITNRWRIKIGAFSTASGVFVVALVVLASVEAI